jgi:hydroxyethylthiazole kinase-like uncharacterized protein yjeF
MLTAIQTHSKLYRLDQKHISRWLPERRIDDNKSRGGQVAILAGHPRMPGAAILAARAALRVGAGYIHLQETKALEFVPEALVWDREKEFSFYSAILAGPGWGQTPSRKKMLKGLLSSAPPHVVLDADALNLLSGLQQTSLPSSWILTPHPGEMARLLGTSVSEVQNRRLASVQEAQKKFGCTVILKGHHTLIGCRSCTLLNPTGNVALAKAGTGDVLAGMVAGFLSQGVGSERAAALACFLHGSLADQWVRSGRDYLSLTPSDLLDTIPQLLNQIRRSSAT